jgi:hypothetical protein
MQRHQSSICTLAQSVNGLSRTYQALGLVQDMRAACNDHGLAASVPSLPGWLRTAVGRVHQGATVAFASTVKSLGVAAYVVLAILVMGLVLRFSGMGSLQAFSALDVNVMSGQVSETHERDLDGRAQEILVTLAQDERGFTPDGE